MMSATGSVVTEFRRLSAFSDGDMGGNPAGVLLSATMPEDQLMQQLAAEVGYSETAFLQPDGDVWRTRYFSPEDEVPFCGHATIASGAALGRRFGAGTYRLRINAGEITVEAIERDGGWSAALTSPPTHHVDAPPALLASVLEEFGMQRDDLAAEPPPAIASAGANHLVLPLRDKATLERMAYGFDTTRALMTAHGLTTIALVWREDDALFHARNAFAVGGVVEDPATGAAAAALGGYLRDGGHSDIRRFTIVQGETMGQRSLLQVDTTGPAGSGITVAGTVREIDDATVPPSLDALR